MFLSNIFHVKSFRASVPVMGETARGRIGRLGEEIAATFLQRKGFTILERNYRRPWGEIDLIAKKADTIHFVEVKTVSREIRVGISREKNTYSPEEQIHPKKLESLVKTSELYMAGSDANYQIDAVSVLLDEKQRKARCQLYEQIL